MADILSFNETRAIKLLERQVELLEDIRSLLAVEVTDDEEAFVFVPDPA